jgi:hypothetical protein
MIDRFVSDKYVQEADGPLAKVMTGLIGKIEIQVRLKAL